MSDLPANAAWSTRHEGVRWCMLTSRYWKRLDDLDRWVDDDPPRGLELTAYLALWRESAGEVAALRGDLATARRERDEAQRDVESVQRTFDDEKRDRLLLADELAVQRGERDQQRERAVEVLVAARNAVIALQDQASFLPEQQAYSTTMTEAERQCAQAVASIDSLIVDLRGEPTVPPTAQLPACTWTEDGDAILHTDCGNAFYFDSGGSPAEHGMKFCGYCGKPLVASPFVEQVEQDDDEPAVEQATRDDGNEAATRASGREDEEVR